MSDIISLLLTWSLPGMTFALACSTVWLAWNTQKMAKSTEKALEQNAKLVAETHELVESNKILVESEERHHQENLRPICIFEMDLSSDKMFTVDVHDCCLNGSIVNKGHGTALECVLYLILPLSNEYILLGLPSLGSGDRWLEKSYYDSTSKCMRKNFIIPIHRGNHLKGFLDQHRDMIFCIKYKDIFGNWLITKQKMNIDTNQYTVVMGSLDENPVPIEGMRRIY